MVNFSILAHMFWSHALFLRSYIIIKTIFVIGNLIIILFTSHLKMTRYHCVQINR